MKKYRIPYVLLISFILMTWWMACSGFVDDVDPLLDQVADDALNNEGQIPFLSTGVKLTFSNTFDNIVIQSEGLSDALFFDINVPNATFPSFQEIDGGDILLDNGSVEGLYRVLGQLRFFSDDLVRRINELGDFQDAEIKREGLFTGYFYGGVARYFYATYIGLTPTEGGGVIDKGPFIPSAEMYGLAIEKFQQALNFAADDYETRVVNSVIARCHLYNGQPSSAATFAQNGLISGDPPFQAFYSTETTNGVWQNAGRGRSQWVLDFRYNDYIVADPNEAARLQMEPILGTDQPQTTFYLQIKYGEAGTPIDLISWQENELMLAEIELSSNNASALARVNAVRASHGLAPLAVLDLNALITERDKELLLTGARLPDQRRFGIFHLAAGKWQYLPITNEERNVNDNIN